MNQCLTNEVRSFGSSVEVFPSFPITRQFWWYLLYKRYRKEKDIFEKSIIKEKFVSLKRNTKKSPLFQEIFLNMLLRFCKNFCLWWRYQFFQSADTASANTFVTKFLQVWFLAAECADVGMTADSSTFGSTST